MTTLASIVIIHQLLLLLYDLQNGNIIMPLTPTYFTITLTVSENVIKNLK